MKLLVVDDQGAVATIICRIAQQGGWEAVHSVSHEGIDKILAGEGVDVLMLDYVIAGQGSDVNGLSVAEALRSKGVGIPILLFTGWPDLVDQERARRLGIAKVLEKPLSIHELRLCLNEAKKQLLDGGQQKKP
jgi:DNA-binding response OmpR family regulator